MVSVHTGKIAHFLASLQLHHTYHAFALLRAVVLPYGQMLYQSYTLGESHLLPHILLRERIPWHQIDTDSMTDVQIGGLQLAFPRGNRRVVNCLVVDRRSKALLRGSAGGHIGLGIVAQQSSIVLLITGTLQAIAHVCAIDGRLSALFVTVLVSHSRDLLPDLDLSVRVRAADSMKKTVQRNDDARYPCDSAYCHLI